MHQNLIPAEDQIKINNLSIKVKGNNLVREILVANLTGIGVQEIEIEGDQLGQVIPEQVFKNNRPLLDLYYEDYGSKHDFEIGVGEEGRDYTIRNEGICGGIEAAVVADEIRKQYAPIGDFDLSLDRSFIYDVKETERKKVLAIGAGGIGNYFAIGAEILGHEVTMVDDDVFEGKNAKKQIFCNIGQSKAERIAQIKPAIEGINARFDENLISKLDLKGYIPDVVVGCVDNIPARNLIRKYSWERKIPYFDGGVSTTLGRIKLHPEEQEENKVKLDKTKTSCQYLPSPSIVIPNSIIGLKLAECAGQHYSEYEFWFDSKDENRFIERYEK